MYRSEIGVIGLGIMGSAMAKNLARAWHDVRVWNRGPDRMRALRESGCKTAVSPRDMADRCPVALVMVTDPAAVDAVLEGPDGWFAGKCAGKLLINSSTVSVKYACGLAARCAARKVRFIDAPVAGSKAQAEAAQLIFLTGGEKAEIEAAKPFLLHMGKTVIYAGAAGNGSALKLCINLIIGQMTSCLAESVTLAKTLGLAPELIFETLHASPVLDCGYFRIKEKNLLAENYAPAFSMSNILKDVKFMLEEADARGQNLPVTAALKELLQRGCDSGLRGLDLSAMAKTLEGLKK